MCERLRIEWFLREGKDGKWNHGSVQSINQSITGTLYSLYDKHCGWLKRSETGKKLQMFFKKERGSIIKNRITLENGRTEKVSIFLIVTKKSSSNVHPAIKECMKWPRKIEWKKKNSNSTKTWIARECRAELWESVLEREGEKSMTAKKFASVSHCPQVIAQLLGHVGALPRLDGLIVRGKNDGRTRFNDDGSTGSLLQTHDRFILRQEHVLFSGQLGTRRLKSRRIVEGTDDTLELIHRNTSL